jgi:Zn-dependent protease
MSDDLTLKLGYFLILILSLSVHEWSHAFAARVLGDSTAERLGRLSLNPLVHLDPVGSVILPLVGIFSNGMLFGWAKPVPVNVSRLRFGHVGYGIVASAGPLSNLLLALICFLGIHLLASSSSFEAFSNPQGLSQNIYLKILSGGVSTNAVLAFFNLVPIPPLDGGGIAASFLPRSLREPYQRFFGRFGMVAIFALLMTGGLNWVNRLAGAYIEGLSLMISG